MSELAIGTHTGSVEVYACICTDRHGTTDHCYGVVCELLDIMVAIPSADVHGLLDKHYEEWAAPELLDTLAELLISAWSEDEPNVVPVNWGHMLDRKLVGEVKMRVEAQPITLH